MDSKSDFFDILNTCMTQYKAIFCLNQNTHENYELEPLLAALRQPVWDYLVENCPSFANRDCDPTEIFSSRVFNNLTEIEKNLFKTSYLLSGICQNCTNSLEVQCRIMLSRHRINGK